MILKEIGEIGVHIDDETFILRPSFYAMSKIGTPKEIVETYAVVMAEIENPKVKWQQFQDALFVAHACCELDLDDVLGYFNQSGKFVKKKVDPEDMLILARCLLKHGITGSQKPLPRKESDEPEYLTEFNASENVALAMAHIGCTESDAWKMTMTSLVAAMRAKFPSQKEDKAGARAPTKDEHEDTMAWFDKIKAKREKPH